MKPRKQSKARNADKPRTETLTFRLSKRLRSLAEVAARKKGVTLANHVESALEASLNEPIDFLRGASIAEVADELYDEDEALCFLKRLKKYPWAMSPEQKRVFDLIRTSPLFYPTFRVYNTALNAWSALPPHDYKPLIEKYGDRFQMQDLDKVQPIPSGILGAIHLVTEETK